MILSSDSNVSRSGPLETVWIGNLMADPIRSGRLYIVVLPNLCFRRVIGWAMNARLAIRRARGVHDGRDAVSSGP